MTQPYRPTLMVVKVGGSLFSDKREHRTLRQGVIEGFARQVADLADAAPGRVMLVSGGGSFGHAAVRSLNPDDPHATLPLTEANFALKWIWTRALRDRGAPAVPIQLAALCAFTAEGLEVEGGVVLRMLDAGLLPVLSGDSVVAPDGSLRILGSDRVPEAAVALWPGPVQVVALTDVAGILADGAAGSAVIEHVDADAPDAAYAAVWATAPWDTSRGMGGKLDAFVRIARAGADCHIVRGDPDATSLRHLLDAPETWPAALRGTRITCGRRAAGRASTR
jgi:isopentenyl phosphate kinase